jgi:hypothetical protein
MIRHPHQALDDATALVSSMQDGGSAPRVAVEPRRRETWGRHPATRFAAQNRFYGLVPSDDGFSHPTPINIETARDIIAVLLERAWVAIEESAET